MTRPGLWRDEAHDFNDLAGRVKRVEMAAFNNHTAAIEPTLPDSPVDGQGYYYSLPGGGQWHFRFNQRTGLWDFSGGPPLVSEVVTSESTSSTSYADLSTVGPSFTAPFDGMYSFDGGAMVETSSASNNSYLAALKIGSATPADTDAFAWLKNDNSLTAARGVLQSRCIPREAAAGDICKIQYRTTNGGAPVTARNRSLAVTPVWVAPPAA